MIPDAAPLGPPARPGLVGRVVLWCILAAVRASLVLSPRPAALLVRKIFAAGGRRTAAGLARHAPTGVASILDERYGEDADMQLDVHRPDSAVGPLPLVVWIHGGGFVGGAKHELADYLRLVASHGYVVAAPGYSLAPEQRYPTPPRQVMEALTYLQANAGRLGIDPEHIALAGCQGFVERKPLGVVLHLLRGLARARLHGLGRHHAQAADNRENGGLKLPPNYRRSEAMLKKAQTFLPGFKSQGGVQWMGFRPSLPDSLPAIGRARATGRVVYAFGHGHLGLTQSAGTARLVADLITGQRPAIDISSFSPQRF